MVFELNFIITTTFLAIRFVHLRSEHSIFFSFAVNWKVFYFVTMQVICYFRREEFHSSSETRDYSFQFSKVEYIQIVFISLLQKDAQPNKDDQLKGTLRQYRQVIMFCSIAAFVNDLQIHYLEISYYAVSNF